MLKKLDQLQNLLMQWNHSSLQKCKWLKELIYKILDDPQWALVSDSRPKTWDKPDVAELLWLVAAR